MLWPSSRITMLCFKLISIYYATGPPQDRCNIQVEGTWKKNILINKAEKDRQTEREEYHFFFISLNNKEINTHTDRQKEREKENIYIYPTYSKYPVQQQLYLIMVCKIFYFLYLFPLRYIYFNIN